MTAARPAKARSSASLTGPSTRNSAGTLCPEWTDPHEPAQRSR